MGMLSRKPERDYSGWETESEYIEKLDRYYQEQNADYSYKNKWEDCESEQATIGRLEDKIKDLERELLNKTLELNKIKKDRPWLP